MIRKRLLPICGAYTTGGRGPPTCDRMWAPSTDVNKKNSMGSAMKEANRTILTLPVEAPYPE